ncbi:MAG: insulinase family protein, partial [Prolixibacteraceae bacterium]|nr:insulinase family protein [Prolixibacteraceae bacterium]
NSYNDSPSDLIFDDFEELIYDGHPIARNILGTPETVRSFNKKKIEQFIARNYQTSEMVICSVGKIKSEKFQKLVSHYFENLSESTLTRKREKYLGYEPQTKQISKDTFQSHCIIGTEAYNLKHEMRLPLVLLNNILGGNSMNSRLNMALRERNGLAYNIEANYTPYTDTGIFMVYFGTEQQNLFKALNLVESEFARLRNQKMGILQLSKARKQLIGQLAIANENREDLMLTIGRSYLYFDKVDTLPMVFKKIENITAENILETANQILDKNRLSTLVYL